MDSGLMFRADDGSLLVTSDSQCYEYAGEFNPTSRSGNVNTYTVTTTAYPLVFAKCGSSAAAGVLSVLGGAGNWTVQVLATVSCPIQAFVPISGAATSGVGVAVYGSGGAAVFDSTKNLLNARKVAPLDEGGSVSTPSGTNMVSYTAGPVRPASSVGYQWVVLDSYAWTDTQYQCTYSMQYVCSTQSVYVCGPGTECGWVYDYVTGTGGYACYPATVCGYQNQQVCGYENVQTCAWVNILNFAEIDGKVKTTTWSIDRGVARISSDSQSVAFDWLRHKEGYYKEIVEYQTFGFSQALFGGLPFGYIPPIVIVANTEVYQGELSKNNTFPYTTTRANTGAQTCITAVRSDYD